MSVILSVTSDFWEVLREMAPYLLFGFFVAGILSIVISQRMVERHLGGAGFLPVVKASVFGVPLPLCSCGVIPVSASLRNRGASRGATTSFLLSTPQTGVDSVLVTFSLLGPVFAVFRPLAAFASGLLGGSLVNVVEPGNDSIEATSAEENHAWDTSWKSHGIAKAFKYGFVTLPKDISKPLILGLILAGFISTIVPDDFFARVLGTGLVSKLIMMLVGLPVYVCATASVPVAAALIAKGVSPGAAFVFLTTGPATNAATIAMVWKLLGKRTALVYLGTVAATALVGGMVLDSFFQVRAVGPDSHLHGMFPQSVQTGAAVLVLGVLLFAALDFSRIKRKLFQEEGAHRNELQLSIQGMTCPHCKETVEAALLRVPEVEAVQVDLNKALARVKADGVKVPTLIMAVEKAGYRAFCISEDCSL